MQKQRSSETSVNVTTETCGLWFSAVLFPFSFYSAFPSLALTVQALRQPVRLRQVAGAAAKAVCPGYDSGNRLAVIQCYRATCWNPDCPHPPGPLFVRCIPTGACTGSAWQHLYCWGSSTLLSPREVARVAAVGRPARAQGHRISERVPEEGSQESW